MRHLVPLLAAAVLVGGSLPAAAGDRNDGVPRFGHVFVLIGENTDYQHLTTVNAPYLMTELRPRSAWFSSYYAATHWSQANYVALVSGQFTDCEQADRGYACRDDVDNLFHQIELGGRTWHTWLEGGTAKCDTGSGGSCSSNEPCPLSGFYTTGNPAINFTDISYSDCLANDVPAGDEADGMSIFNTALARGDVSDINLIVPNGCDDGEAHCKPLNNRYLQFDSFLRREIPLIEASPAFGSDGVIVITYDEDQRMGGLAPKNGLASGGHTLCLVLSRLAVPGDYGAQTLSYSVLRTLQDGLRLQPYLGDAASVTTLPLRWH